MRLDRLLWTLPASTVLCAIRSAMHDDIPAAPHARPVDPWARTAAPVRLSASDELLICGTDTLVLPVYRGGAW